MTRKSEATRKKYLTYNKCTIIYRLNRKPGQVKRKNTHSSGSKEEKKRADHQIQYIEAGGNKPKGLMRGNETPEAEGKSRTEQKHKESQRSTQQK